MARLATINPKRREEELNRCITRLVGLGRHVGLLFWMDMKGHGDPILTKQENAFDEVRDRLLQEAHK